MAGLLFRMFRVDRTEVRGTISYNWYQSPELIYLGVGKEGAGPISSCIGVIMNILMFDEYLEPPHIERLVPPASAVPVLINSAGIPSSTTIDQDAPSTNHSPSFLALQSPSSHQDVTAGSTIIKDNPFAYAGSDPFVNVFALKPSFKASSSGDVNSVESSHVTKPHHHLGKCSKDHPLENVIGNPS
ncbi:hypothetical protein Tco_1405496 [Tanacetum coccineum]